MLVGAQRRWDLVGPDGLYVGCWRTEQQGNGQRATCAWPHQPDSSSLSLPPWRHRHAARSRRRVLLCLAMHAGAMNTTTTTTTTTRSMRRTLGLSSRLRTSTVCICSLGAGLFFAGTPLSFHMSSIIIGSLAVRACRELKKRCARVPFCFGLNA